jgi:hypothetical protein
MLSSDLRMAKTIMETRLEEAQHTAGTRQLLSQAGVESRGWLSDKGCRLLCQLGHLFVALGNWLQDATPGRVMYLEETST